MDNTLKEKIMEDINFREKCSSYPGVNWDSFNVFKSSKDGSTIIVVDTPNKDIFIIMDDEYNTIGIHHFKSDEEHNLQEIADVYKGHNDVGLYWHATLSDIFKINYRVLFAHRRMCVNDEWVDENYGGEYVGLLAYIKILAKIYDDYFHRLYQAEILNIKYPDHIEFFIGVYDCINQYIKNCIKNSLRPTPTDLYAAIGENCDVSADFYHGIYLAIDYLLYEKGYRVSRGNGMDGLEQLDNPPSFRELSDMTREIKKVLDVSYEEVKNRYNNGYKYNNRDKEINLATLFSSSSKKI